MCNNTEPNDSVYPSTIPGDWESMTVTHLGLTKREYFAGQSLITLMAQDLHYKEAAAKAVIMTDALIEALNMSPEELLKYDK
jgi:hypothetical protein